MFAENFALSVSMESSPSCTLELPQKALRGQKFKSKMTPAIDIDNLVEIPQMAGLKTHNLENAPQQASETEKSSQDPSQTLVFQQKNEQIEEDVPILTDESFSDYSQPTSQEIEEMAEETHGLLFDGSPRPANGAKSRVKMVIKPISRRLFDNGTLDKPRGSSPKIERPAAHLLSSIQSETKQFGLIPYDRASFGSPKGDGGSKSLNGSPKSLLSKQVLRLNLQREDLNPRHASDRPQATAFEKRQDPAVPVARRGEDYGFLNSEPKNGDGISSMEMTTRGGSTLLGYSNTTFMKNSTYQDNQSGSTSQIKPNHDSASQRAPIALSEPEQGPPHLQGSLVEHASILLGKPLVDASLVKMRWDSGRSCEVLPGPLDSESNQHQESGPLLAGDKKVPLAPRNTNKITFNFEKANMTASERGAPAEPLQTQSKTARPGVMISFNKTPIGLGGGMTLFGGAQYQNNSNGSSPLNSNLSKNQVPSQKISPKNCPIPKSTKHQQSGSKGSITDMMPLKLGGVPAAKRVSKKLILEIPDNPVTIQNGPGADPLRQSVGVPSSKPSKTQNGITATQTTPAYPKTPDRFEFSLGPIQRALVTNSVGNLLSNEDYSRSREANLTYHIHKEIGARLASPVSDQVTTIYEEGAKEGVTSLTEHGKNYQIHELIDRLREQDQLIANLRSNLEQVHVRNETLVTENSELKLSFSMLQHKYTTLLKSLCAGSGSVGGVHTSQSLSSQTQTVDLRASDPKLMMLASSTNKFSSGFNVAHGLSSSQKVIEEKTPERGKGSHSGIVTFQQIAKEWSISNSGSKDIKQTLIAQKNFSMKERIKDLDMFGGSKLTPGKKSMLTPGVVQNLGSVGGGGYTSQFSSGSKRHTGMMMTPKGTNKVTFHSKSRFFFTESRA